jgi:hypothetical protein
MRLLPRAESATFWLATLKIRKVSESLVRPSKIVYAPFKGVISSTLVTLFLGDQPWKKSIETSAFHLLFRLSSQSKHPHFIFCFDFRNHMMLYVSKLQDNDIKMGH